MTSITKRIKKELFEAEKDYTEKYDVFKAKYPHGVSFCFETVSAKAASDVRSLYEAEGKVNGLSYLVKQIKPTEKHNEAVRNLFRAYNNAETEAELALIYAEYCKLYTIRN